MLILVLLNRLINLIKKPTVAFCLAWFMIFISTKSNLLCNVLFIFVFLFFQVILLFLLLPKKKNKEIKSIMLAFKEKNVVVLNKAQHKVFQRYVWTQAGRIIIEKAAQVVSQNLSMPVVSTVGTALSTGAIALEAVQHERINRGSSTDVEFAEQEARRFKEEDMPRNQEYQLALANNIKAENERRVPGGPLSQAIYDLLPESESNREQKERRNSALEFSRNLANEETRTRIRNEDLERNLNQAVKSQAWKDQFLENEMANHERMRTYVNQDVEKSMEQNTREWRSLSAVERLEDVAQNIRNSPNLMQIGEQTARASYNAFTNDIEQRSYQEIRFVFLEHNAFVENYKAAKKTVSFDSLLVEKEEQSSKNSEVFESQEVEDKIKAERTSLQKAYPISKEFMDELNRYLENDENISNEKDNKENKKKKD